MAMDLGGSGITNRVVRYESDFKHRFCYCMVIGRPQTRLHRINAPCDAVPCNVRQIENQVLRFVVLWTPKNLGPILEIGPSLFRRTTREGRKSSEKLEQNTAQGPVINRVTVRLSAKDLGSHIIRRSNNGVRLQDWIVEQPG